MSMQERLITDTCSVVKLVVFGDKLFKASTLSSGKLIIHPKVHREIHRWPKFTKEKYKKEIEIIKGLESTPNLKPSQNEYDVHHKIISKTISQLNKSVGEGDIEQFISVLHFNYKLVTNDGPLTDLAKAFDVDVFEAEEIALEAYHANIVSFDELKASVERWKTNYEKRPRKEVIKEFFKFKIYF